MAELLEASEPKKCRLASAEGDPTSKLARHADRMWHVPIEEVLGAAIEGRSRQRRLDIFLGILALQTFCLACLFAP